MTPAYENIQVIGVTAADGVLICGMAASGTNNPTSAAFYGYTMVDTVVNKNASLPAYNAYANVTFDTTWQPLQSISIVTTGKHPTPLCLVSCMNNLKMIFCTIEMLCEQIFVCTEVNLPDMLRKSGSW